MYFIKTPELIKKGFPKAIWKLPTEGKELFLTFDDGPIPEITPWVLDQLKAYAARATFFCIGSNIEQNQDLFKQLIEQGHSVANHTFNHQSGLRTNAKSYRIEVEKCGKLMDSDLFRPPYGVMKPKQYKDLIRDHRIVMWDVLCGDFDRKLNGQQCAVNVIENAEAGSVVVLHDSLLAWPRLQTALPIILDHFSGKGFSFKSIV
ncbi:MAG: polysaccharide deacetylase family protein [Bacteroidetes bacterium]|nr:polysaccharide deacetylase family protein [Bacteroidota bacterium]